MYLTSDKLPDNMTRVLCEHINFIPNTRGTLEFAYYKDGMFKFESGERWVTPDSVYKWIGIRELYNKLDAI